MIEVGNYVNILSKIASEKIDLKIEPHPKPYNVTYIDKTTQSITQNCLVSVRCPITKPSLVQCFENECCIYFAW